MDDSVVTRSALGLGGAFTLHAQQLNWTAAEASCVLQGGHLASVHSMAENSLVSSLCASDECWIGFNDIANEGIWIFSDGSVANFSSFPGGVAPWNPGEPNGKADEATDGAYMVNPSHPNGHATTHLLAHRTHPQECISAAPIPPL
jgi:hypothetical protein